MSGTLSYHAGLAAENRVAADYERRGFAIVHRRWRGPVGEIDLIARKGAEVVFIEVKSTRRGTAAMDRVTERQLRRIHASASAFLANEPDGQNTKSRFDVALVHGNGPIETVENAYMM